MLFYLIRLSIPFNPAVLGILMHEGKTVLSHFFSSMPRLCSPLQTPQATVCSYHTLQRPFQQLIPIKSLCQCT